MRVGPRTGRGVGWCAGYARPGYAVPVPRLGLRLGYRGGRGWRNMHYATGLPRWTRPEFVPPAPAAEQELADLKAQAGWLGGGLDAINRRIQALEGRDPAAAE